MSAMQMLAMRVAMYSDLLDAINKVLEGLSFEDVLDSDLLAERDMMAAKFNGASRAYDAAVEANDLCMK